MIPRSKESRAVIDLINAFSELCPTQYDKDEIRKRVSEMQRSHDTERQICAAIAGTLLNGLRWGNWPSAIKAMNNPDEK